MERRRLLGVIAALGIVATVGAGSVLIGTGAAGVGSLLGDDAQPPALLDFESSGAHCTDNFTANSSSSVAAGGENTVITYARNVSLPGPSSAIGGPTFEQLNDSTYLLSIPIEDTEKAPLECPGVARYNATVRIPAGEDPWNLIIEHDGQTVTIVEGDSDSSVLGGSARVGQSVSAERATNTTENAT